LVDGGGDVISQTVKTNILRAALFTPGPNQTFGLPMLLWGLPGIAKSAIMRQLAANYGVALEQWR
jgi:hypothetical protein